MSKKIDKLENFTIFSKLMKDDGFINEILDTKDGMSLIKKFDTYGVDLNQIDFSELCKILTQRIQVGSGSYNLNSTLNPSFSPDFNKTTDKTVVSFVEKKD